MKITLPNGCTIEGTDDQIVETINKLGFSSIFDETYYHSESKGWTKISEMNTTHLRNAILKQYQEWVNKMHEIKNPKELVALMMNGIEDKTWLNMVKEYSGREEE